MASDINFLDNFPVNFSTQEENSCDNREFCQLAEWGDRFEFAYEPPRIDVSVTNGSFTGSLSGWTAAAGWGYLNGKARLTNSTGYLQQSIGALVGSKYVVTFTVSNYSGTGAYGLYVNLGGDTTGSYQPNGVTSDGTYSVILLASTTGNLIFGTLGANVTLDLGDVSVELVQEPCSIFLKDTQNNIFSPYSLPANITPTYSTKVGYSYLWSQFGVNTSSSPCSQIVVYAKENSGELITNGTFNGNLNGWTNFNNYVTYNAGKADFSNGFSNLSQVLNVAINEYVYITFTVSNYVNGNLRLAFQGGQTDATGYAANGTYTTRIKPLTTSGKLIFYVTGAPSFSLDNVSAYTYICQESSSSQCYKLSSDHGCDTKLLKWTNGAVNGFNYPYYLFYNSASSYGYQWLRVECSIKNANYSGENDTTVDSGGNGNSYYSTSRKSKDLIISGVPEYVHDAIAIGLKHKEFYIDDVRYISNDSLYTPQWSDDVNLYLSESVINIGLYSQEDCQIDE